MKVGTLPQTTTAAYVVLHGSEIKGGNLNELVFTFYNTGVSNTGTAQVYGSDFDDWAFEKAIALKTIAAAGYDTIILSKFRTDATAPKVYRNYRAKIINGSGVTTIKAAINGTA